MPACVCGALRDCDLVECVREAVARLDDIAARLSVVETRVEGLSELEERLTEVERLVAGRSEP